MTKRYDVVPFDFDGQMIRVVERNGQPWWVAADVAKVLGYRNAPDMVRILDEDERAAIVIPGNGGPDTHNVRTRGGLIRRYRGVIRPGRSISCQKAAFSTQF